MIKKKLRQILLVASLLLMLFDQAYASHILGGEIYYKWMSGNTYRVVLVMYADCAGGSYATMDTSVAVLDVYNDTGIYNTYNMALDSSREIAAVCSSQFDSTTCKTVSGTAPGVKEYTFGTTVTLPGASSSWHFQFTGDLTASSAVRVNSISNISAGSTTVLEATLDNTMGHNTTPSFQALPLFFCSINQYTRYNSLAVDPDGDSVHTILTPALTLMGGTASYLFGYSATQPLAVDPGSLKMDSITGEISFMPNLLQRSVVEQKIKQYRHGILIGTSMREMIVTVYPNKTNELLGHIGTTAPDVTQKDSVSVAVDRKNTDHVNYTIVVENPDSNNVTVTATGLPEGATFSVTGQGTKTPVATLAWDIDTVKAGTYFYNVTFADDGCLFKKIATLPFMITVIRHDAVNNVTVDDGGINIYPNPSSNSLYISTLKDQGDLLICILNINGQTVGNYVVTGRGKKNIDITPLISGVYWVIVQDGRGREVYKQSFIKR